MRSIPLKICERLNLLDPLMNFCIQNYGHEQFQNIREFIVTFNNIRNQISSMHGIVGSENFLNILKRFLGFLQLIEGKFLFGDLKGYINIKFKWADSFNAQLKASLSSIKYEKAAIVYNIGAVMCNIAVNIDRSTQDGLKEAVKLFSMAAGVFIYIKDNLLISISGKTTIDLSEAALSMNISMILAQAQSCTYEKAVKDKFNRSLLSKLAYQISIYYNSAYNHCGRLNNDINPMLSHYFRAQEYSYLSAAHFQKAMAEKTIVEQVSDGYGGLVSRLKEADKLCKQAMELIQQHDMRIDISALKNNIKAELTTLEKDNLNVYLEVVPDSDLLPKLEAANSVKAIELQITDLCQKSEISTTAIEHLVPSAVKSKIDEIYFLNNKTQSDGDCQLEAVELFLKERNLPFSLEKEKYEISNNLWEKILKVQKLGGSLLLEAKILTLNTMSQKAAADILEIEEKLCKEESDDDSCRKLYGNKWTIQKSSLLNLTFISTIINYKTKLQQAQSANITIMEKHGRCKKFAEYFSMTKNEFENEVPDYPVIENANPAVVDIHAELSNLDEKVHLLQQQLDNFKKLTSVNIIASKIMRADQDGESRKQALEIEKIKLEDERQIVNQMILALQRQLKIVDSVWNKYNSSKKMMTDLRNQFLIDVENAANLLIEAYNDENEGEGFFSLLSEYLKSFSVQVDDWISARSTEMQKLKNSIIATNDVNSAGYPTNFVSNNKDVNQGSSIKFPNISS